MRNVNLTSFLPTGHCGRKKRKKDTEDYESREFIKCKREVDCIMEEQFENEEKSSGGLTDKSHG